MKKHTKETLHEALKSGEITVRVGSWSVVDGKHTPYEWRLECPDGLFQRSTRSVTSWSKWWPNPDWTPSSYGYVSQGYWRKCGWRQQEALDWYFSEAHKLKLIEDRYTDGQK